jgi:CheY-like chemotaxis protein/anti-sigma regulatory factor (Ser/Thr protein kinase)
VPVLTAAHRTREQLDFVAGVISRQTRHLTHLIDDLLNVGRAVAGKITLARAPLDLGACVRGVSTTLQATGRFVDRQLDLDLEPVWISGDTTRIEQIATNLLVNATTFTSAGGRIRVRVSAEGDAAVLEVSDDGRGIAGEHLPHVFDVFFQADSPETRATGGLGIGLTMVQRLARLHDAEVTAQSAGLGRGARFIVRFPRIPEPAPTGPSPVAESPLAPRAILVVEDNAAARESLQIALELQGHRVESAADGRAALDLVRIHHPSVALLDIGLPGMDGYELARRLRALFGPQILLIALTGYGMETDARKARGAGFDQHLTKPVDVDKLTQVMEAGGRSPQAIGSD